MTRKEQESRKNHTVGLILFVALAATFPFSTQAWAGLPTLSINDITLDESTCEGPALVFTVTLSYLGQPPVTVNYATSDGSPGGGGIAAVGGQDYVPVSGTLTFTHNGRPNGPRGSYLQTITVPLGNHVVSTGANDGREFTLTLSGATNATIIKPQGAGTLTNAAVNCTPPQHGICYVNFCGVTTACKSLNKSAVGPAFGGNNYCQLVQEGGECVGTAFVDSDGDGFSDALETQGYVDMNANGAYDPGIDIPLPGADPNKPDVYLHYDYTYAADHNHNPPPQAIQWIVDAFAAHGVNLHIDPQHNAICENAGDAGCITAGTGAHVVSLIGSYASCTPDQPCPAGSVCSGGKCIPDPSCVGASATSPEGLRAAVPYLDLIKPAYHHMIFGHYVGCPGDNSVLCANCPNDPTVPACGTAPAAKPSGENFGMSEVFGNDSIVALQPWADIHTSIRTESWAGIAMHELGHNFGLLHGGSVDAGASSCNNCKPNYVSVMSYLFYGRGIQVAASPGSTVPQACTTDADCNSGDHAVPAHCSTTTQTCFRIDYSDRVFNTLAEAGGLDETLGLQGGADNTDISFWFHGPGYVPIPTNGAPIDWNKDGNFTDTGVFAEINDSDGPETELSQDDWATIPINGVNNFTNLNFGYQCGSNYFSGVILPRHLRFGKEEPMVASAKPTFEQLFLEYWQLAERKNPATGMSNTMPRAVDNQRTSTPRKDKTVDFLHEHELFWPRP
jgi:hypothetical protein